MKEKQAFHLLLVENSKTARLIMTKCLESEGYKVTTVENGLKAIECIQATTPPFDVLIMDVFMPQMNGNEATRKIRALEGPSAKVPVIALSGSQEPVEKKNCLDAGMNDFIQKTPDNASLVVALERYRTTPTL